MRRRMSKSRRDITLEKLNCFTLGALIALFERAVGLYAELININAYHQPGVEAGKKAASNILELQSIIENILEDYNAHSIESIAKNIKGSSK